jgi:hypothetical protein
MFFPRLIGLVAAFPILARAVDLTGYEYVVVGSGAGGGVSHGMIELLEPKLTCYVASGRPPCPRWSQDASHRSR